MKTDALSLYYELGNHSNALRYIMERVKRVEETHNVRNILDYLKTYDGSDNIVVNRIERIIQLFKTNPELARQIEWENSEQQDEFWFLLEGMHSMIAFYHMTNELLKKNVVLINMAGLI